MSSRTKLILLLVIITLLFIAVLFADVLVKQSQKDPGDPDSLTAMFDGAFSQAVQALAPKLKLTGLRCEQQRVDRVFTLNASRRECAIDIPRKKDTDVRTAELSAKASGLDVYVFAEFDEMDFPERKRDREKCILDGGPLNPFRLEVKYTPKKAPKSSWHCWLKQERGGAIAIVVLEKGGRLDLTCVGCDSSSRSVGMQMR
ncbi:MAG: hypothetical protein K0U72_01595 [Gammaproteobacteria bacterium]|nr:hypothetical protein [Gammaproteobacteria bacterium]